MKKMVLFVSLATLLMVLSSCSSSGGSYYGGYEQWKKDNNYGQKNESYDRHYSNDEIHDFVNSYGGKW